MHYPFGTRILNFSGTATATGTTYHIDGSGGESQAYVSAAYTGGDGTTQVLIYLETSIDGTTWVLSSSNTLNSSGPSLAGIPATSAPPALFGYVRGRVIISGLAPTTCTVVMGVAFAQPVSVA